MKLRVAVCDDQPEVLESMKTILKETGLVSTVACYDNIRELREELQEGKMVDLLMMDICHELDSHMAIADQKKNGIDFAYELNQQFPFLQIIYITGYNDRYSQDIFLKPVRLAGFLTKPIQQDYVIKLLLLVQEKQKEDESEKLVVEGKGRQTFLLWEIVYIKSRAHVTEIHTSDGKMYECKEKVSELEQRVNEKFVRCHQSYLINMQHVECMDKEESFYMDRWLKRDIFILDQQKHVPISKNRYAQTRRRFEEYLGNGEL